MCVSVEMDWAGIVKCTIRTYGCGYLKEKHFNYEFRLLVEFIKEIIYV